MNRYLIKYNLLSRLSINYICINITKLVKNDKIDTLYSIVEFYKKYDENIPIIAYYMGYNDIIFNDDLDIISLNMEEDNGIFLIGKLLDLINVNHNGCILNISYNTGSIYGSDNVFNKVTSIKNIKQIKYVDDSDIITYNNLHIIQEVIKIDISKIRFNKLKYTNILININLLKHIMKSDHKELFIINFNEFLLSEEYNIIEYLSTHSRVLKSLINTYIMYKKEEISSNDLQIITNCIRSLY